MSKRKTISIDSEAYRVLKSNKHRSETWSDVIKKTVFEPLEGKALVKELKRIYREASHGSSR